MPSLSPVTTKAKPQARVARPTEFPRTLPECHSPPRCSVPGASQGGASTIPSGGGRRPRARPSSRPRPSSPRPCPAGRPRPPPRGDARSAPTSHRCSESPGAHARPRPGTTRGPGCRRAAKDRGRAPPWPRTPASGPGPPPAARVPTAGARLRPLPARRSERASEQASESPQPSAGRREGQGEGPYQNGRLQAAASHSFSPPPSQTSCPTVSMVT
jgi:hypothetical protein